MRQGNIGSIPYYPSPFLWQIVLVINNTSPEPGIVRLRNTVMDRRIWDVVSSKSFGNKELRILTNSPKLFSQHSLVHQTKLFQS